MNDYKKISWGYGCGGMVKELPILFNSQMVNAILRGSKTETRRVVKNVPDDIDYLVLKRLDGGQWRGFRFPNIQTDSMFNCPFGNPGSILWVRESFSWVTIPEKKYQELKDQNNNFRRNKKGIPVEILYKADYENNGWVLPSKWTPSIYMPKWANRIKLRVVSIRSERLQAITALGALREGLPLGEHVRTNFRILWDSINEKRGFPWGSNPIVWVVRFERMV